MELYDVGDFAACLESSQCSAASVLWSSAVELACEARFVNESSTAVKSNSASEQPCNADGQSVASVQSNESS